MSSSEGISDSQTSHVSWRERRGKEISREGRRGWR